MLTRMSLPASVSGTTWRCSSASSLGLFLPIAAAIVGRSQQSLWMVKSSWSTGLVMKRFSMSTYWVKRSNCRPKSRGYSLLKRCPTSKNCFTSCASQLAKRGEWDSAMIRSYRPWNSCSETPARAGSWPRLGMVSTSYRRSPAYWFSSPFVTGTGCCSRATIFCMMFSACVAGGVGLPAGPLVPGGAGAGWPLEPQLTGGVEAGVRGRARAAAKSEYAGGAEAEARADTAGRGRLASGWAQVDGAGRGTAGRAGAGRAGAGGAGLCCCIACGDGAGREMPLMTTLAG
mmetsp:Transcript_146088/g.255073  ORF Transcript_146088/g.255073 Transcript_146088/m.255073 type:complete len:287 (-) Transcript_146088:162-1022(-)